MITVKNDRETIAKKEVDQIVRKLCVSYAHIRNSFNQKRSIINKSIDTGALTRAVSITGKAFGLPPAFRSRVGYKANNLKGRALAAMLMKYDHLSPTIPISGNMLFVQSQTEAIKMPRYRLLHIIAHEMSHARMFLDRHELAHSEFATDVLALLVTGDQSGFCTNMSISGSTLGYIRKDLYPTLFKSLSEYYNKIYLE